MVAFATAAGSLGRGWTTSAGSGEGASTAPACLPAWPEVGSPGRPGCHDVPACLHDVAPGARFRCPLSPRWGGPGMLLLTQLRPTSATASPAVPSSRLLSPIFCPGLEPYGDTAPLPASSLFPSPAGAQACGPGLSLSPEWDREGVRVRARAGRRDCLALGPGIGVNARDLPFVSYAACGPNECLTRRSTAVSLIWESEELKLKRLMCVTPSIPACDHSHYLKQQTLEAPPVQCVCVCARMRACVCAHMCWGWKPIEHYNNDRKGDLPQDGDDQCVRHCCGQVVRLWGQEEEGSHKRKWSLNGKGLNSTWWTPQ